MYAMLVRQLGGPEKLERVELPDPEPLPGHVVIDVRAIGCNFADILMTEGRYQLKPPLPFAPGSEVAGIVRSVGEGVPHLEPGQRVAAMLDFGAYSSVVSAPADFVVRLPPSMPFDVAAGFGVAYQTAYIGLAHRAGLKAGESLLVHAAAGGVGLAAVEVGRALGARVWGTAGSADKCALAVHHGAEACFDVSSHEWVEEVLRASGGRGVDVVYDPVGGEVFHRSLKCLAWSGRLVVIGFASGDIPELKMNRVLLKNIAITGLNLGSYKQRAPEVLRDALQRLFDLYEQGALKPEIYGRFPLERAREALELLRQRKTAGKVILIP
ncbi:MAG: oxidoreductase [Candidatus Binatia bacterium]|nr:MAG: oxidoreductase [Candidatus Binatia bacterium]